MPREVRALNTVGCVVLKELKPSQLCGADGAPFFFLHSFFIHCTDFYTFAPIFIHKFRLAARGCARPEFVYSIHWRYFYAFAPISMHLHRFLK